ncbi:MAG: hypothetical protein FWH55_05040 [Oscillospiraceae bacterium]|nr:hypothetical protein [Oscillospiraceae bacterium]
MEFTYDDYKILIDLLRESGYRISSYHDYEAFDRCVILRHDVDHSLRMAANFAQFENILGVKSAYFILLSSDFYNVASARSIQYIDSIRASGHEIGLHFDESKYQGVLGARQRTLNVSQRTLEASGGNGCKMIKNSEKTSENEEKEQLFIDLVEKETEMLSRILSMDIKCVSMHIPSKHTLESNYIFRSVINTYSSTFYSDFKYLSDSRHNWREPVIDIIKSGKYKRLHILTHPVWYYKKPISTRQALLAFFKSARLEQYEFFDENFNNLQEYITKDDVQ